MSTSSANERIQISTTTKLYIPLVHLNKFCSKQVYDVESPRNLNGYVINSAYSREYADEINLKFGVSALHVVTSAKAALFLTWWSHFLKNWILWNLFDGLIWSTSTRQMTDLNLIAYVFMTLINATTILWRLVKWII